MTTVEGRVCDDDDDDEDYDDAYDDCFGDISIVNTTWEVNCRTNN